MDSKRGDCGMFPVGIIEHVLSFLPVPVLCRMRSVCKTWNELISTPSFHDRCDLNGKNHLYLFMWMRRSRRLRSTDEPSFVGTLSFLDLDARHWYLIEAIKLPRVCACGNEIETRFMAMDDGLVCELTSSQGTDNNFALTLSDPVAKTRRMLPAPPEFYYTHDAKPHLITIVDDASRGYKVVLFNNLCQTPRQVSLPRMYIHESFTNEWRGQRNLLNGVEGKWASSPVVLHERVFVSNHSHYNFDFDQVWVFSYKPQDGTWAEVWRMRFSRDVENQKLVVSNSRLFLILWLDDPSAQSKSPSFHPPLPQLGVIVPDQSGLPQDVV